VLLHIAQHGARTNSSSNPRKVPFKFYSTQVWVKNSFLKQNLPIKEKYQLQLA
jgi:hypothetical protein